MRKITVISMLTLDGVIQGPGGTKEDTSGRFKYSGWLAPYAGKSDEDIMSRLMKPADLLLGRKTFEIWEHYWPAHAKNWPGINEVTKYVVSKTRKKTDWQNCVFIKSAADIKKIKKQPGGDIKVWGSSVLIQMLLKNDLVDEMWLMIYPLTLGKGKKLFTTGAIPAAFTLAESMVTDNGVIIANYKRAGIVKTGNIGPA